MHKGTISKLLYTFYFDCLVLETRAFHTAFSSLELAVGFSFSEIQGTTPVFVSWALGLQIYFKAFKTTPRLHIWSLHISNSKMHPRFSPRTQKTNCSSLYWWSHKWFHAELLFITGLEATHLHWRYMYIWVSHRCVCRSACASQSSCVDPRDWTRLGNQHLYPLKHLVVRTLPAFRQSLCV